MASKLRSSGGVFNIVKLRLEMDAKNLTVPSNSHPAHTILPSPTWIPTAVKHMMDSQSARRQMSDVTAATLHFTAT